MEASSTEPALSASIGMEQPSLQEAVKAQQHDVADSKIDFKVKAEDQAELTRMRKYANDHKQRPGQKERKKQKQQERREKRIAQGLPGNQYKQTPEQTKEYKARVHAKLWEAGLTTHDRISDIGKPPARERRCLDKELNAVKYVKQNDYRAIRKILGLRRNQWFKSIGLNGTQGREQAARILALQESQRAASGGSVTQGSVPAISAHVSGGDGETEDDAEEESNCDGGEMEE